MEQKKILWVILSVSLFVLIIFGIALFLYSPSRNSATAQAGKLFLMKQPELPLPSTRIYGHETLIGLQGWIEMLPLPPEILSI